jgi:hypothetical protein
VGVFLFLPSVAHAEAIQETLRTNQDIKNYHNTFMNIVNIPVILLFLIIGFAEILRLKVDTYGFKKILPALILAMVAAQFSYVICKLIIDVANVTLTLFTNGELLKNVAGGYGNVSTVFNNTMTGSNGLFPSGVYDWNSFSYGGFFKVFFETIFMFVAGILMLVLAFLFIVRTWYLYLLVIFSGAAFMMIVLPVTKGLFNKWWSEFLRWTFIPVASMMFLWLGSVFISHPVITDATFGTEIMNIIVAGLCLWGAITMPFKMGGIVMKKFYEWTGAKWGLNKAKTKWVDPWVADWKERLGNWYRSQGSGNQTRWSKLNPLGAIVRRGEYVKAMRGLHTEEKEGWDDQLWREAMGGKLGKDGDVFRSNKRQVQIGKYIDHIQSLKGEKDWKRQDLLEKFYRTEEGKQAMLRTAQYGFRVEGTNATIEQYATVARNMGLARDPAYMKDPHYARMVDKRNKAMSESFSLKMVGEKLEHDVFQEVENNAYLLDMSLQGVRTFQKELAQLKEKAAQAQTDDEKRIIEAQMSAMRGKLAHSNNSYNERMRKFYNRYYNKEKKQWEGLSFVLRGMVTDNQGRLLGVETDANGNFISADPSKAKSFSEVLGFDYKTAQKAYRYHTTRRTKRLSLSVDDEKASVTKKREDTDSAYEIENTPFEREALPYIITGDTSTLDEAQIRKTGSELFCMGTKGMSTISSDKYAKNAETIARWIREDSVNNISETANQLRTVLANNCVAYLQRVVNNPQEQTKIRERAATKFKKIITEAIDARNRELAEKMSKEEEKLFRQKYLAEVLSKNRDYQTEVEQQAKDVVSIEGLHLGGTAMEQEWKQNVTFRYDQMTGGLIPTIDSQVQTGDEATQKSIFLEALSNTINLGPTRGVYAEGKNSWSGTLKEQVPVFKRQMGKNEEEIQGYERVTQILKKAADEERAKIMEEKGSVNVREEFIKRSRQEGEIDVD